MGPLEKKSKLRRVVDRVKKQWKQFNNKKVVPESSIPPSKHRHHLRPMDTSRIGVTESNLIQAKKNSMSKTKAKAKSDKNPMKKVSHKKVSKHKVK